MSSTLGVLFRADFGGGPMRRFFAPGRINLVGAHLDYNGGDVLPMAVDRGVYAAARLRDDGRIRLRSLDQELAVDVDSASIGTRAKVGCGWANYPLGVWHMFRSRMGQASGFEMVVGGDLPMASGLSSSAAIEVVTAIALDTLFDTGLDRQEFALLAHRAENGFVGLRCGIMDQFASACGVENKLLLLDCRSLEWKTVPLPDKVSIVIADTTVRRKLTSGEYNKRRSACEEAVRRLQQDLPDIRSLRDVSVMEFDRLAVKLPGEIEKRARHVVEEIERANQAEALLEAGDVRNFGRLMNECHVSLRDLNEVSCPELNVMVNIAQTLDRCHGARLTGAGSKNSRKNHPASQ